MVLIWECMGEDPDALHVNMTSLKPIAGNDDEGRYEYSDDAMEREATAAIRGDDGISLRSDQEYRDDFDDEAEDAQDLDKVFRLGDGDEEQGFRDRLDRH